MRTEIIIFKEAFFARLLPLFNEVTLTAERTFHAANYLPHAIIAGGATLCASALLYGFGFWLRRIPAKVSTPEQQARIEKMQAPAKYWLPWLLILSPTPLGTAVIIAAGFFSVRPLAAAAVILASELLWRGIPMYEFHAIVIFQRA